MLISRVWGLILYLPSLIALSLSLPAAAEPELAFELNPGVASQGGLIEGQLVIGNPGGGATGQLSLQVLWPEGAGQIGTVTDGGVCTGSFCRSAGQFLVWDTADLGSVPSSESLQVSFSTTVKSGAADGTVIPFEVELYEDGQLAGTLSQSVRVQSQSPLQLAIHPELDPAPPGAIFEYVLDYGNASGNTAFNAALSVELPAGVTFVSASGGGANADGTVTWALGNLLAGAEDRERLRVQVAPGAIAGELLVIDQAGLSAEVSSQERSAETRVVTRVGESTPELAFELNPGVASQGGLIEGQLVIGNPGGGATGQLSLQVLWPEGAGQIGTITDGGVCTGSFCRSAGQFLVWDTADLGSVPSSESLQVSFSTTVKSGAADGTVIPFEVELYEDGQLAGTLSQSVRVQSQSPLQLAIHPELDPAPPGAIFEYVLDYGNASGNTAFNAALSVELPAGVTFVSASGGGANADGTVTWALGNLLAGAEGRERLRVQVAPGAIAGELLVIDQAGLSAEVSSQERSAETRVVTRVGESTPELAFELNPGVASQGGLIEGQLVIGNPGGGATGQLSLQVLWPEGAGQIGTITDGGVCTGSFCRSAGQFLVWDTADLGSVPSSESLQVSFSTTVKSGAADGTVIPFEVELYEDGQLAGTLSQSVRVQSQSPLQLAIHPELDPAPPGAIFEYVLDYGNASGNTAFNAALSVELPAGVTFVSASGGGANADGTVTWALGNLLAGAEGRERLRVQVAPGAIAGELLVIDQAGLSAEVSSQERSAETRVVTRVGESTPELAFELNPGVASQGGLIEGQLVIGNPGGGATGQLSLQVLWPEGAGQIGTVTDGGVCTGSFCRSAGQFLVWDTADLGSVPSSESLQVSFSTTVKSGAADGTVIPFEVELYEDGQLAGTLSQSVRVQSQSPLQLAVTTGRGAELRQQADPVLPGDRFSYQVTYGNPGVFRAIASQVSLPLPGQVSFVAASSQGQYDPLRHAVVWDLQNSVVSGAGGNLLAEVELLPATQAGELVTVDDVVFSGEIAGQRRTASTAEVTRVGTGQLSLSIPRPPETAIFDIANNSGSPSGLLEFRVRWPEGFSSASNIEPPGGSCPGSCDPGEILFWGTSVLGNLFSGGNIPISFAAGIGPPRGSVAALEATLINDGAFDGAIELIYPVNPIGVITNVSSNLQASESGGTDSFIIQLSSAPANGSSVTLAFNSSDTSEGTVSPASVTFTDTDWDEPRTITVTGVDDQSTDGPISYFVEIQVSGSTDPDYAGLDPRDIRVTNADNDGDSDGDGVSDRDEEVVHGTNPNNPDTDGDGLPDGYEIDRGFDPLDPSDASFDADGDGFTNLEEFEAGTDSRDAGDIPISTSLGPALLFEAFCNANPGSGACQREGT